MGSSKRARLLSEHRKSIQLLSLLCTFLRPDLFVVSVTRWYRRCRVDALRYMRCDVSAASLAFESTQPGSVALAAGKGLVYDRLISVSDNPIDSVLATTTPCYALVRMTSLSFLPFVIIGVKYSFCSGT